MFIGGQRVLVVLTIDYNFKKCLGFILIGGLLLNFPFTVNWF